MPESPFTFESLNKQIVGIAHHPIRGNGSYILMCHGFTGNKSENNRLFVESARSFAKAGFYIERFDFFGSGDSEGEFRESRISINMQNLRDAINRIRNRDCKKLVVLGISMGAATAILTVKEQPVDGLILWSTVPDMKDLLLSRLNIPLDKLHKIESLEYDGWLIDKGFYEDAIQYDILAAFHKIDITKLIVQGSNDDPVFTNGYERFREKAIGPTQFELIDHAGHTYASDQHRNEIIQKTQNWLIDNFT